MASVGREAAMGPCRDEGFMAAMREGGGVGLDASSVRPVSRKDYDDALCQVRAYSKSPTLRNREIETETLILASISQR